MSAITTRSLTGNHLIDAIAGTTIWNTQVLNYNFVNEANADRVLDAIPDTSSGSFQSFENSGKTYFKNTVLAAFSAIEAVANLQFQNVPNLSDATLKIGGIADYYSSIGLTAGTADFPGHNPSDDSLEKFESFLLLNSTLSTALLVPELGGANSLLSTTLHELGHVLGLDHPHETNNGTLSITNPGLDDPQDSPTDNRRYTVLSYEDGGLDVLYGREFGHSAGPSALDIAALQAIYGANPTTNQSATLYRLSDPKTAPLDVDGNDGTVNIGRAFFSIWDTGGLDELVYGGSNNVLLNLNDATLSESDDAATKDWIQAITNSQNYDLLPQEFKDDIEDPGYHAGGFFSRVFRNASSFGYDLGGYSIANGVTVENAYASNGSDFLIGNEVGNVLDAGGGQDFLHGAKGNDTLIGGGGADELWGGQGNDQLEGGFGSDHIRLGFGKDTVKGTLSELAGDLIEDFTVSDRIVVVGAELSQVSSQPQGNQTTLVLGTNTSQTQLTLNGNFAGKSFVAKVDSSFEGDTIIELSNGMVPTADVAPPIVGSYSDEQLIGSDADNFIFGARGDDTLIGQDGNDHLIGSHGHDFLVGGSGQDRLLGSFGADTLSGGAGKDKFVFHNPYQIADQILDFEVGQDILVIKRLGFKNGLELGTLKETRFTLGAAASTPQHRFIYNSQDGSLFFDPDGSKSRNPLLIAQLDPALSLSHADFKVNKGTG